MSENSVLDLKNKSIYPSWTKCTVRYSDLDPNGHVNNGGINAFFEDDTFINVADNIIPYSSLINSTIKNNL